MAGDSWVNGGAGLTIGGQRVDFIYRSLEHVERVIAEAEAGRYELDYAQQTLAHVGNSSVELLAAVENVTQLFRETVALTDKLYQPRFVFPL